MPRGRPKVLEDEPIESAFDTPLDEIEEVLEGLDSDDAKILLFRVQPQGAPFYIAEFAPSDFNLEAIKNTFGGGKYKYVAKQNRQRVKQGFFNIEGEPIGYQPRNISKKYLDNGKLVYATPENATVIQKPLPAPASDQSALLLMIAENNRAIQALATAISAGANGGHSRKDFYEEMAMLKNIFVTNPSADFSKNAMDLIKSGMDIVRESEGGPQNIWMTIFEKAMPLLQQFATAFSQASQIPPPRGTMPTNLPANQITETMPNQPPKEAPQPASGFEALAPQLQIFLPAFIQGASSGTPPEDFLNLILNNMPGESAPHVAQWLQSPTWFADLVKLNPAITAQQIWWQDLRAALLQELTNPQTEGGEYEQTE